MKFIEHFQKNYPLRYVLINILVSVFYLFVCVLFGGVVSLDDAVNYVNSGLYFTFIWSFISLGVVVYFVYFANRDISTPYFGLGCIAIFILTNLMAAWLFNPVWKKWPQLAPEDYIPVAYFTLILCDMTFRLARKDNAIR